MALNPEDNEEEAKLMRRYYAAAHAVQSGTAHGMNMRGEPGADNTHGSGPKHLRVGLDVTKAEMGGLASLLIAKRLITELEYTRALVEAVEQEQHRLEEEWGVKFR